MTRLSCPFKDILKFKLHFSIYNKYNLFPLIDYSIFDLYLRFSLWILLFQQESLYDIIHFFYGLFVESKKIQRSKKSNSKKTWKQKNANKCVKHWVVLSLCKCQLKFNSKNKNTKKKTKRKNATFCVNIQPPFYKT